MRRGLLLAAVLATGALALAPPAGAGPGLTPTAVRIGDHPSFVRVVVDFTGGVLVAGEVQATDPDPTRDGRVRIVVPRSAGRGVASSRDGITVRVRPSRGRAGVSVSAATGRFTYMGYAVYRRPERLVIDMFKRRVPAAAAFAHYGRPGCLALTSVTSRPGTIAAQGTENGVFEHSFPVDVRSAAGRLLGRRPVSAVDGRWSARIPYRVGQAQVGIVEAVELSAKDGALACLARSPVSLQP